MKKFLPVLFFLVFSSSLFAQNDRREAKEKRRAEKRERINAMVKQEEEGVLAYDHHNAFGIGLRTNGYFAFYERGQMKTPRFTNLYSIELSEIRSDKEQKVQNSESYFANTYIWGKVNNFYQLKLGFGQQYILGQKGNKNGIAVMGIYGAGLSAGLQKPYYLEKIAGGNDRYFVKFDDDSTDFLDPDHSRIFGSGGFSKGFSELQVVPGAYAKAALRFDFGRFNETIQAVELGLSADFYTKKIQIMALNPQNRFFLQGHVAFIFGSRR